MSEVRWVTERDGWRLFSKRQLDDSSRLATEEEKREEWEAFLATIPGRKE